MKHLFEDIYFIQFFLGLEEDIISPVNEIKNHEGEGENHTGHSVYDRNVFYDGELDFMKISRRFCK